MTWIRGPWWDSFWILSGLPMGLALLIMPPACLLAFFTLVVVLETGHSLSPIVLAWSHAGFRQIMLGQLRKYILLPLAIFLVALAIGAVTSLGWSSYAPGPRQMWRLTDAWNWFPMIMWAYWVWNIYHFGMQNFGVVQLYRRRRDYRLIIMWSCLGLTAFGMAGLPKLIGGSHEVFLIAFGVFAFSHWMTAIGLCSAASGRGWLFVPSVLLLGVVGFIWMKPTPYGDLIRDLGVIFPVIICARAGLGFVHFLYDRWIWKFSDPCIRSVIGRSFKLREA